MNDARVPPHDLDAERAVLSACMLDAGDVDARRPGAVEEVRGRGLQPHHFYSEAHRRMFEACVDLHERQQPVDAVQVGTWLRDRDRLTQVGGAPYIAEVTMAVPMVQNIRAYATTVLDKWLERSIINTAQAIAAEGYVAHGDARDYVVRSAEKMQGIALAAAEGSSLVHIKEVVIDIYKRLETMAKTGRLITGKTTGIARLDRITSGLHNGDLTILAGRPGMGKTSLVLCMATAIATGDPAQKIPGEGVAIFSLEMPREQLGNRLLAVEARVDVAKFRTGGFSADEWQRLGTAAQRIVKLPIFIDDTSSIDLMSLRAKVRGMQIEIGRRRKEMGWPEGMPLGAVMVDYLQLMGGHAASREELVGGNSRGLKALAKDTKTAVLALAQLNREAEKRKDNRPALSDLRDSGAIEQDADNVVFIYRDDYYNKDSHEQNIAELIIAKQRNGPTTTVKCRFDKQYTRFDDLREGEWESDDDPDLRTGGR